MIRQLLIATTNTGKFTEIKHMLNSLPFIECISLTDLKIKIEPPEESQETLHGNSFLKAKYYADKSGLLTLADDTGLYIDSLNGWPGERSARIADNDGARIETVLNKMQNMDNRAASFKGVLTMYDPLNSTSFAVYAETQGTIIETASQTLEDRFGFDPIFYVQDAGKTYAQMDTREKNSYSHRGKCAHLIKYYLQNTYGVKHAVVPIGFIVEQGKILMSLRNDPHNPSFHNKWEFPGGGVEFGETIEENIKREVWEEVGYEIEPVKQLSKISVRSRETDTYQFQVFLVPYVCKIIGGNGEYSDSETIKYEWFEFDDVQNHPLIGDNNEIYLQLLPELKEVAQAFNL